MIEPEIVNVVATASLNQKIDLNEASKIENTIYDHKKYRGRVVYLKTLDMQGKVVIFSSGKLISVGTKSLIEAKKDLQTTVKILARQHLISPIHITVKIRNIVAIFSFNEKIDLEKLIEKNQIIYEPEQFPAAIMKQTNPKATMLIFASGKIVLSGVKSIDEIKNTIDKMDKLIKSITNR